MVPLVQNLQGSSHPSVCFHIYLGAASAPAFFPSHCQHLIWVNWICFIKLRLHFFFFFFLLEQNELLRDAS